MPNPDEHDRVLIYTEGTDFNGEQVFDVKAETLNECFYADPEDQPEVCKHATHWAVHPRNDNDAQHQKTGMWWVFEIRHPGEPAAGFDALVEPPAQQHWD